MTFEVTNFKDAYLPHNNNNTKLILIAILVIAVIYTFIHLH